MNSSKNLVGETILGYLVEEEIGKGGFGTVYKVSRENMSGKFTRALKHIVLPTTSQYQSVLHSMGGDYSKADSYFEKALRDIISEINILNDLTEKDKGNIVTYYDNDIVETRNPLKYDVYILMEYLTPLTEYIEEKTLCLSDVLDLGIDLLQAIRLCHNNNIVHRDIKEDNIFVNKEGHYKLGDFGVAKLLNDTSKAVSKKGTEAYIAPEVYLGKEEYTNTVDIYSLGIVLYKLLNDLRIPFLPVYPEPYDIEEYENAIEQRLKGMQPPAPSKGSKQLSFIITKAISSRDERYQSADEFYEALINVKSQLTKQELRKTINEHVVESKREYVSRMETIGGPAIFQDKSKQKDNKEKIANENIFIDVAAQLVVKTPIESPIASGAIRKIAMEETTSKKHIEPTKVEVIQNKNLNLLIYLLPMGILGIGAGIYYLIVPKMVGELLSLSQIYFSSTNEIVARATNIMPSILMILISKGIFYILLVGFIVSLYIIGRQINKKEKPQVSESAYKGKDAYFKVIEIKNILQTVMYEIKNEKLKKVIKQVKKLEEKLEYDSDFGRGNENIISCENKIVQLLEEICYKAQSLTVNGIEQEIDSINKKILQTIDLLEQRGQLKIK